MARELRATYTGGNAVYAVVRRLSDDYVWNGTAFEAWSDASIATYDVALTDRGGDEWDGDFPSGIGAGDYRIAYYEYASGTTPTTSDLRLTTDDRHWDGAVLSTTSTVDLSAYALTTLDDAKRYLRITDSDDDTLLTQLINAVSLEIERVCGVQFKARDRRERINGVGQRRLSLKQWPVISLNRLSWGNGPAMTVTYSGSAIRAEVGVSDTAVRISSTSTAGALTASTLNFTDYPSLSLLAAAINAVSGWTATTSLNLPSADLNPFGGADAKSRSVLLGYPDRADIVYTVDHAAGLLEIVGGTGGWGGGALAPMWGRRTGYEAEAVFPAGHQYLLVEYRAGFESIPADVAQKCNEMVFDAYNDSFVARGVTAATIGPFTWKANPQQAASIRDDLAAYMDISRTIGGI